MVQMTHIFDDLFASTLTYIVVERVVIVAFIPLTNIPVFEVAERLFNMVCY